MTELTPMSFEPPASRWLTVVARSLALLCGLVGFAFAAAGGWLLTLGGSAYYLLAGLAYLVGGFYLARSRSLGAWLIVAVLIATLFWAVWEVGFNFWPLVPRLVVPGMLALLALALIPSLSLGRTKLPGYGGAVLVLTGLLAMLGFAYVPHGAVWAEAAQLSTAAMPALDWTHYASNPAGQRFAGAQQINRENVGQLRLAWTFRSGDLGAGEDQNVPMQISDTLYTCSKNDLVAALDADTGQVRWRFDPKASSPAWQRCRGLGYYTAQGSKPNAVAKACDRRIIQTTIDARLIALDAATGKPCAGFGANGIVDLKVDMGEVKPSFYFQTSAPTVVRNLIVIGGWVRDNQERGEPSGVVRAFDARTGQLVWAWDLGDPSITGAPPPGKGYSRGTPNMWSTPTFDDKLGLIYLPLGNATPDYYGRGRSPAAERYASSIVALDVATGRERWHFQTVHHDLWDYDVPSPPVLYDIPNSHGGITPALLQTTKRGQLFLLNRLTGKPLAKVIEKPAPQTGKAPSEWLSPTQPYSVGMPAIGADPLSEKRMWGMTAFDQLWCRIRYRQLRYEGDFTPPGTTGSIQWPGNYGGFNWGGASVDPRSGVAYMNDIRMPVMVQLRSHQEVAEIIKKTRGIGNRHGPAQQFGTPYGVTIYPMLSPLGIPCVDPPFGTITAVDLKTRKIAWQVPLGTPHDTGPLGLRTHLNMPIGMPTIGGTTATAGGLVFFAGSQDFAIRALDAQNGKELWRHRLPVGSDSTPMTFTSPKTGRQYVVISVGGVTGSTSRGDYVMAFALPQKP